MKNFIYLIIFTMLYSFALVANDLDSFIEEIVPKTSLSNDQLKHLREELKVQKIMIEEIQSLKFQGVTLKNLSSDDSVNKIQKMLLRSIEASEKSITKEISDAIKTSMNFDGLKSSMSKFKKYLQKSFVNKKVMGASLIRQYGMEVGLIYMTSLQVDVTLPLIMMSQGHLGYSVLLATPVSSVVTGGYVAIKNAVKFRQVVKSFGGLGKTFNHYKNFFKVKKFFNQSILSKTDLIDIRVNNKSLILTASRENLITKNLSRLGYNKRLNYTNVLNLLESKNLMSDFLYAVKSTKRPDHVKLLRIINRISLTQDEEVLSTIAEHFKKDVQKVTGLHDYPKLSKWAIGIANSDSMESFIKKLALMPTDAPPKLVDRLWRTYIIPTSSKNIRPFMSLKISKAFGKMINGYNKNLFGQLAKSLDTDMGPSMHMKFLDFLFESLSEVGVCQSLYRTKGSNLPLLIQY